MICVDGPVLELSIFYSTDILHFGQQTGSDIYFSNVRYTVRYIYIYSERERENSFYFLFFIFLVGNKIDRLVCQETIMVWLKVEGQCVPDSKKTHTTQSKLSKNSLLYSIR